MGKIISIFFCAYLSNASIAFPQSDTLLNLHEEDFIEGTYSDFYVDNLGNIYLLSKNNQLKKIDNKGDSASVYNALRKYGDIYSIDVSNPLKILVYHKDFGTIIVLDRFLSSINTIDLRKIGILQARATARSYDNNYWVFDEVENKLKKIDDNGNILLSTPDFRVIFNEPFSPVKIIDYNNFVYLYDQHIGWMIFDYYGAFKQKIELPGLNFVQVAKDVVYGFNDSRVCYYNTKTFNETHFNLALAENNIKVQSVSNFVYALNTDGLHIYATQ